MNAVPGQVLFRLASERLAVPSSVLVEVLRMVAVARQLPRARRHLLGVIDCRGRLVPLVDLGARLGLAPPRTTAELVDGHVLVLRDPSGEVGYAVDEVCELLDGAVEPLPAESSRLGALARGALRTNAGLVPLLDPGALMTARLRAAAEVQGS